MNTQTNTGVQTADILTMDLEHDAQLALLDALEAAINVDEKNAEVYELLQQLVEHTNMHFLSEQLAMRLHAYEGYESHLEEHERLMAEVRHIQKSLTGNGGTNPRELIAILRRWLVVHMETMDQVLIAYLNQEPVSAGAAGSG